MVKKNNSVFKNIKRIIDQSDSGTLFNSNDFKDCGPYSAIRTAIVDLCKANYIERVFRGVYVKPDNANSKKYLPDDITLAMEIDRKNGSEATPKGKTLDFIEGRLLEMPKVLDFYSTGSGRTLVLPDGTAVKYTLQKISNYDSELYPKL